MPSSEYTPEWHQQLTGLTQRIEQAPDNPHAYLDRGHFFLQHSQADLAIADYSMAIDLNPALFEGYNSRGVAHGEKGQFARALCDLDRAIALSPKTPIIYVNRGIVHCHSHHYRQSIRDHNHAITLWMETTPYPQQLQRWRAYHNRAIVYIHVDRLPDSLPDIERALVLAPEQRILHVDIAKLFRQCDNNVLDQFFSRTIGIEVVEEITRLHRTYGQDARSIPEQIRIFQLLHRSYAQTPFTTLTTSFRAVVKKLCSAS